MRPTDRRRLHSPTERRVIHFIAALYMLGGIAAFIATFDVWYLVGEFACVALLVIIGEI